MTKRIQKTEEEIDDILESQIGDIGSVNSDSINNDNEYLAKESVVDSEEISNSNSVTKDIGDLATEGVSNENEPHKPEKLKYYGHQYDRLNEELDKNAKAAGLTGIGDNIYKNAQIREGWMEVDRALLKDRNKFYPDDWKFMIKPATVEAIRYWSTINDSSANSVDDVFNEVLKSCLAISTPLGPIPWYNINNWDRFFFILLIREYTFINGDVKIEYTEDCVNCEAPVTFSLTSQSLLYDIPGEDVMSYFDVQSRTWNIVPSDFEVESGPEIISLYIPTVEKDINIKAWLISRLQENHNFKVDQVFIRFLPWICPKISKDLNIAKTQIRNADQTFKSWDMEMFAFMDEVLRNISVTPSMNLVVKCPSCGEEVTSPIRFQDGISSLFAINSKLRRTKKFGSK